MEEMKELLQEYNSHVGATFKERDFEKHALLYTEDCRVMAPGRPTAFGRESVIHGLKAFVSRGFHDMRVHIDEHGPLSDDLFYERGHTQWVPKEGGIVYNKYVVLRKKVDGKPLVYTLIYNDSSKPEGAEE